MGICTVASYRGAQLFEIIGLEPEVVDLCFPDTASRIGGAGFARLDADARELCAQAWDAQQDVDVGGLLNDHPAARGAQWRPACVAAVLRCRACTAAVGTARPAGTGAGRHAHAAR
ncbi:hypothetical protein G6F35_017368 [Rhizopus arrhizus]|nr:hypothetical protein G6F35_017368 [Rhizopus arrhizus]